MITYDSINFGNFFQQYQQIKAGTVNLFLSDLPYGLFDHNRLSDIPDDPRIDLRQLETALHYLLSNNGQAVLFCNLDLMINNELPRGRDLGVSLKESQLVFV